MGNCAPKEEASSAKAMTGITEAIKINILEAMNKNNFFNDVTTQKNLSENDLLKIVSKFRQEEFDQGEQIFSYGDPGEKCYFIQKGAVDVFSKDGLKIVTLNAGTLVGEIGFLNGALRAATVCANRKSALFSLSQRDFEAATAFVASIDDLQEIPIIKESFKGCMEQMPAVISLLEQSIGAYRKKSYICSALTQERFFYIIIRGQVRVSSPSNSLKEVEELGKNDYFGEVSLINDSSPQACELCAQAVGVGEAIVAKVSAKDFDETLKPVKELLKRRIKNLRKSVHRREQFEQTVSSSEEDVQDDFAEESTPLGTDLCTPLLMSSPSPSTKVKRKVITEELGSTRKTGQDCGPVDCVVYVNPVSYITAGSAKK
jgi:CRP-like cAMP-binding protein